MESMHGSTSRHHTAAVLTPDDLPGPVAHALMNGILKNLFGLLLTSESIPADDLEYLRIACWDRVLRLVEASLNQNPL